MFLFFVLSGFVIHYSYASQVKERRFRGISFYLWVRFAWLWQLRALDVSIASPIGECRAVLRGFVRPGGVIHPPHAEPSLWIWSTNVDSYCVVRGCLIESVISFKRSSRPDAFWGGDPELAKQQLQEAGLKYFLFMKDCRMIDLLSLSKLFSAPETIGRYLGVKWSGGSTYLLTRIGLDARPIGPDFLEVIRAGVPNPTCCAAFDELAPVIATIAPRIIDRPTNGEWRIGY